jgi:transposase
MDDLDTLHERCCGLDIHKDSIVACLLVRGDATRPAKELRRFSTMTDDILALGDWLAEAGCTHLLMESTGVYWKPLFNLLEDRFTVLLANAQHVKQVPGRKTDMQDAEWLAVVLRYGLVRPSYVPARPQRQLRELTRYRTSLVRERATAVNRLQKTLEGANLKLGSVASDVLGKSGRAILQALVEGETDPEVLAALAVGSLQQKLPQLRRALTGRMQAHQRFLLGEQLAHIRELETRIERLNGEVQARLGEQQDVLRRLDTIPGVSQRTAELIVAELGTDAAQFPSPKHAASWLGLCPGNNESAGKHRSGKTRHGNPWLKSGLVEAAKAAARTKGSALAELFQRVAARRGRKRATLAVAHRLAVIAYCIIRDGTEYEEREQEARALAQALRRERRLVAELRNRGYVVLDKAS